VAKQIGHFSETSRLLSLDTSGAGRTAAGDADGDSAPPTEAVEAAQGSREAVHLSSDILNFFPVVALWVRFARFLCCPDGLPLLSLLL
jgi:hypothetical protein